MRKLILILAALAVLSPPAASAHDRRGGPTFGFYFGAPYPYYAPPYPYVVLPPPYIAPPPVIYVPPPPPVYVPPPPVLYVPPECTFGCTIIRVPY